MSTKRSVGKAVMAPLVAAATSVAASYVVKKGPEFAENTLLPWLRDALQSAGGVTEKLPDKARSAVSSGSDLAEQLTDRARDVTGVGGEPAGSGGSRTLSQDQLSQRSDERAKRRAQRRRKTTRRK